METGLSRMERKRKKTKKIIVDSAMELINRNGYDGTTMEQIAEKADIAKGTLYNYYPTKEAIISDFIKNTFQTKNSERLDEISAIVGICDKAKYIINNLMDGVKNNMDMFEKYLLYQMREMVSFDKDEKEQSGISVLMIRIISDGQKTGEIRSDIDMGTLVELLVFVFIQVVKKYYADPTNFDQQAVVDTNVSLFINAVTPIQKGES